MNPKDLILKIPDLKPELKDALDAMIREYESTRDLLAALTADLGNSNLHFLHRHNLPNVEVYHDADQSINSAAETTLAFNQDRVNDYGMHDKAVNNSRITFIEPGDYIIGCNVTWDLFAGGFRAVHIKINGTIYIAAVEHSNIGVGSGAREVRQIAVTFRRCLQNDYAEVTVFQNTGGALPITHNASSIEEFRPKFWAQMIVPHVNPVTPAMRALLPSGQAFVSYLDRFASRQPQGGG